MASALPRRAESGLTIGQVIAAVRAEFPELTQSKLRFLEEQGIVRPTRTASSYRMFRPADVERLRTALALQRDHFLPLREIRAHLDALDAGAATPLPITPTERLTRADLLRVTGAAGDLLDAAIEVGLIAGAQVYHAEARTVLVALVALEAVGIAPRHLGAMQRSVTAEADLVAHALAPSQRADPVNGERQRERARAVLARLDTVRQVLRERALARPVRDP